MDSTKGKSKVSREEKQATAKLDEQIEKVGFHRNEKFYVKKLIKSLENFSW